MVLRQSPEFFSATKQQRDLCRDSYHVNNHFGDNKGMGLSLIEGFGEHAAGWHRS